MKRRSGGVSVRRCAPNTGVAVISDRSYATMEAATMTWCWTIPNVGAPGQLLRPPLLDCATLRAIIPTCGDWAEARESVEGVLACRPRPAEIVLVNDNALPGVPDWARRLPIAIVDYAGNRGAAAARNAGAFLPAVRPATWFYFTDGACRRDPSFFAELVDASMAMDRTTVAMAGPVVGVVDSIDRTPINTYMTEEAILCPPRDAFGPQAIITANAAVCVHAFRAVGGFCEAFPGAGGEDLDLGLRLRRLGPIGWADRAVVRHAFEECSIDFTRRFERYGGGTARLARRFGLPSLGCGRIVAAEPRLQWLADLQVASMARGYAALRNSPGVPDASA
jgi:hypothetical protein